MGELFALACALAWAFAVILFRKSGETVSPLALNLFRVSVSSGLFLVTLVLGGKPILGQAPWTDYAILMLSGVIAIALSDTLFHMCLNRVGAGISAIVDTFYSPFILLFAFFMLGERLSLQQILGMSLIVGGILVATRVKPPVGIPRSTLLAGISLGIAAMCSLAFGIVLAKPVLERSDIIWATSVRQFGSLLVLVPVTLAHPDRRRLYRVFQPQKSWRFSLAGTVLGSYLALILWIAGMKFNPAGKAAILNQTSTIYILLLASVLLKEAFTFRKGVAAGLALAGVILVLDVF
jgi:drug/metabolite transporter (DMT)-like permease